MGVLSKAVLGCLVETGAGLAFRAFEPAAAAELPRRIAVTECGLANLARQGWDPRIDPEPHCLARLRRTGDGLLAILVEYVNPHHNMD